MRTIFGILAAGLLLGGKVTIAQERLYTSFTQEGLIKDWKLAMDILGVQHPNPYKFTDSLEYKRQTASLLGKMASAPDIPACSRYAPIRLLRDVHTSMGYAADDGRMLYSQMRLFPLPVLIERGKMLVNIRGEAIPFGAEILRINQEPVDTLLDIIAGATYSDGFIESGVDRVYSDFQTRYSLHYATRTSYDIEYRAPGEKQIRRAQLPAADPQRAFKSQNLAVVPVNLLERSQVIYPSYDEKQNTGILTVNSFAVQEAYAYKEFSEFFKEVNKRGYKHVVIDVRTNGGGNPAISALLFSFLARQPFRNEYNYRTRTIGITNREYLVNENGGPMSEEEIRNLLNFMYQRFDLDTASGYYLGNARLREGLLENFPPDKDSFKGNVYVLTGGGTVSAATYFASLVQKNKRGLIVGKETGSGEQSTTAAWFLRYKLPNTKSILTVPMSEIFFFNATSDNGRGVIPDREVPLEKYLDYARSAKDPELNYVFGLTGK